jgi:hypothetical protein
MFKHINGNNTVEMPARDWKIILRERIDRFTQKSGNLVVIFAGDVGPGPFTAVLTEVPVERPVVIAACDEQAFLACRFAKQFQERPQLLLFLD